MNSPRISERLGPLVEAAGMVSYLNHGAASHVSSEGCNGVTQEHLERFVEMLLASERDCRTCKHWAPHHRADMWHCSSSVRCVDGHRHEKSGAVQEWASDLPPCSSDQPDSHLGGSR